MKRNIFACILFHHMHYKILNDCLAADQLINLGGASAYSPLKVQELGWWSLEVGFNHSDTQSTSKLLHI